MVVCTLVVNWVCFLEEATFSSLSKHGIVYAVEYVQMFILAVSSHIYFSLLFETPLNRDTLVFFCPEARDVVKLVSGRK